MDKESTSNQQNGQSATEIVRARSYSLAAAGPKSVSEIIEFSMAIACDTAMGLMSQTTATATTGAVGRALKGIELQLRYGPKSVGNKMLGYEEKK